MDWSLITPSDTVDIPVRPRRLMVITAGNLVIRGTSGNSMTLTAVPANTLLSLSPARVMATGTTATVWGLL